jgi:hypothetical protein
MTGEPDNLVLEHLKRIQTRLDTIERALSELKAESVSTRAIFAEFMRTDVRREGAYLELERRIARIEMRLELHDGPGLHT